MVGATQTGLYLTLTDKGPLKPSPSTFEAEQTYCPLSSGERDFILRQIVNT